MAFFVQLPSHFIFLIWGIWMVSVVGEDNRLINKAQETVDDLNMFFECSYEILKIDTTQLQEELDFAELIYPLLFACFAAGCLFFLIEVVWWCVYCCVYAAVFRDEMKEDKKADEDKKKEPDQIMHVQMVPAQQAQLVPAQQVQMAPGYGQPMQQ